MGEFITQYWIEVIFGFVTAGFGFGYKCLAKRLKDGIEKQGAVEKGIQALLRDRIINLYNHYKDKGFCPIYALENAEALFVQYQALGGNGAITELMEKLRKMPTEGVL